MTAFVAGLVLGFAGSAHCVLMCGPLVAAARGGAGSRTPVRSFVAYHGGRGLVYMALAASAGLLGRAFWLAGLGSVLSVGCGVVLLASVAPVRLAPRRVMAALIRPLAGASARIRARSLSHPLAARILAGMVNGLLPCGLTYAAVLTAAALQDVVPAQMFMAGFWAGTLPALAAVTAFAGRLPSAAAGRLRWLTPASLAIVGVLLIVRGLLPVAGGGPHESMHGAHRQMPPLTDIRS